MRKSNFMLKSKIDRLYDILQMQKEKHHDLKLELTRMLADIQWYSKKREKFIIEYEELQSCVVLYLHEPVLPLILIT